MLPEELSRYGDGLESRCSIPGSVQADSGAHPASYPVGIGGSFPGPKVAEAWS